MYVKNIFVQFLLDIVIPLLTGKLNLLILNFQPQNMPIVSR